MNCGHCKTPDVKIEHVKTCSVTTYKAKAHAAAMLAAPPAPAPVVAPAEPTPAPVKKIDWSSIRSIPAGRYATPGLGKDAIDFWRVEESSKGYRFISRLLGAPGDFKKVDVPKKVQVAVLVQISLDPQAAGKAFADHFQACSRCAAPLTDDDSRARGLGPDCAKILGW